MFINRYLIRFAKKFKKPILFSCLLDLTISLLGSCISLCLAVVVQKILYNNEAVFESWMPLFLIACIITVRFLLDIKKIEFANFGSCGIKEQLRKGLIEKLFELGPAYTIRKRTGDIASTISNKVEWLSNYYVMYLPRVMGALINAFIIILILIHIDVVTALICFTACLCMNAIPLIFFYVTKKHGEKEWKAHSDYYSECLDSIQGINTLKAFNADSKRRIYMHKKSEELRKNVMSHLRLTTLKSGIMDLFFGLGGAFSAAIAVVRSIHGDVDTQTLVYIYFLANACFAPMINLASAWHMGYRAMTASPFIYNLLNEEVLFSLKRGDKGNEIAKVDKNCDIEFNNVSFAYNSEEGHVIKNISFKIPNNAMLAIVGSSGSGKSTIAHILAGFYPVSEGKILIGNKEINQFSVSHNQGLISAVWQDTHIFYGTVYDNILVGKPEASFKEIEEAAKNANIDNFVKTLPQGYQTLLGEKGIRFSGGERQRIALARVFLRNSPILIFDEATSSLDRKNEAEIQKSLYTLKSEKTILAIAHRLSTIQNSDLICVIEQGEIKEYGTHEQLLTNSEKYKKLVESQIN